MPEIPNVHFTYSLCVVKRRPREDQSFYLIVSILTKTYNMLGNVFYHVEPNKNQGIKKGQAPHIAPLQPPILAVFRP